MQGGQPLLYLVLISTILGNMGIFIANVFEDAWQLTGMAEQGLLPHVFSKRMKKFDTPYVREDIFLSCNSFFFMNHVAMIDRTTEK